MSDIATLPSPAVGDQILQTLSKFGGFWKAFHFLPFFATSRIKALEFGIDQLILGEMLSPMDLTVSEAEAKKVDVHP